MADAEQHIIRYGSFGRSIYDVDDKCWIFERSALASDTLKCIAAAEDVAHPEKSASPHITKLVPSTRRRNQKKVLVNAYTELVPAADLLSDFVRISEATLEASNRHDTNKGDLIAHMHVRDETINRPAFILAHVSGPTGSDVQFVHMQTRKETLTGSSWLDVPLVNRETGTWYGPGAPVQALRTATSPGEHFFAARLLTATMFFRPSIKRAQSASRPTLEPNFLFKLSMNETGGSPHSDVAFNPWNVRRFAVVDHSSRWSVSTISLRGAASVQCLHRGTIHSTPTDASITDGWARITWVCDSSTIVVCDRRHVKLFDISGDRVEAIDVNVHLGKVTGWILDLQRLPVHLGHVSVLTSTRLLVFDVVRGADNELVVKLLIDISHYRSPDDLSLHIKTFQEGDDDVVIIRSNLNSVALCYKCDLTHDLPRLQGPFDFSLCNRTLIPRDTEKTSDVQLVQLSPAKQDDVGDDKVPEGLLDGDTSAFFLATILTKDYQVQHYLYAHGPKVGICQQIVRFTDKQQSTRRAQRRVRGRDFIEDDETSNPMDPIVLPEPQPTFLTRRTAPADHKRSNEWTVCYSRIVHLLNNNDAAQATGMDQVIEAAVEILRSRRATDMPTLRDLCEGEVSSTDFGGANDRLKNAIQSSSFDGPAKTVSQQDDVVNETKRELYIHHLSIAPILQAPFSFDNDPLAELHHSIRRTWNTGRAVDLSAAVHSSRNTLSQQMAAEMSLASLVLRQRTTDEQGDVEEEEDTQEWRLPVRSESASGPSGPHHLPLNDSSQLRAPALPTPSMSGTRSTATGSSYSTYSLPLEVTRLSHYTSFSASASTSNLPRKLDRVLRHWTLGADPSIYDWRTTARAMSHRQDDELEEEEMTERERQRLQRKAERALRRQRREAEETARQQLRSSHAPEIFSGSQPASRSQTPFLSQPTSFSQPGWSSQPMGLSQVPASQVLPGRHGGRPAKKKRRSGF